jgi:hypothetical protein
MTEMGENMNGFKWPSTPPDENGPTGETFEVVRCKACNWGVALMFEVTDPPLYCPRCGAKWVCAYPRAALPRP